MLPDDGDEINGRYTIVGAIGKGGGGQVFRAHDKWKNREVALKYLLNPKNRPNALARFQDEFFKLKQFPHPNIGMGYDFEVDSERKLNFFTTELIEGKNLLDAAEKLSPLEVEDLVVQILRALTFLHEHQFNHFDIKPPNVLVTADSKGKRIAKLIDFGVSDFGFTGKLVGTASYMAPEMSMRDFPDHRADLYSLGVMWFHVLARQNPFRGENPDESKKNHHEMDRPDAVGQSKYLNDILKRLMAINREDRFQLAPDVIKEINQHKGKDQQYEIETAETKQSYLPTQSRFVGRHDIIKGVRAFLKAHQPDEKNPDLSSGPDILLISGAEGSGKTRLLEEICRTAQPNGFVTYGANINDPAALDRLRGKIDEAIDNPSDPILIWVDDYAPSAISDDIMKLRDHLLRWRALSVKPLRTCLIVAGRDVSDFKNQKRTEICLEPFTIEEMEEYILTVTGFEKPPRGFVKELNSYTEGRPGMVTSLMRALLNEGYLLDKIGRWKASTFEDLGVELASIQIPEDIRATIEEEFKNLDADECEILTAVAAWRGSASLADIALLVERPIDPKILNNLILKEWIGAFGGNFGVANPVRRDVVLSHAKQHRLEKWYDKIAGALKGNSDANLEDIFWYEAYGSNVKKAVLSKWQLAQHYFSTHRYLLAIQMVDELREHNPKFGFEAGILKARSLRHLHQNEQAKGVLKNLQEFADNPNRQAVLFEELTITAIRQKQFESAESYCMHGTLVAQQQFNDDVWLIRFNNWLGQIFLDRGGNEQDAAIDRLEGSFRSAEGRPLDVRVQLTNNDLCRAYYQKGMYDKLLDIVDYDMQICEEANEMGKYLKSNYYKCEALRYQGNYEEAEKQYKNMEKIAKKYRDRESLFLYYQGLANIYSDSKRHEKAIDCYDRAMDVGGRLDNSNQVVVITINKGIEHNQCAADEALVDNNARQRHRLESERTLLSALEYLKTNADGWSERPHYICRAQLELGDLYYRMNQYAKSHQYLDDAEKLAKVHKISTQFLFWIALTRGEAYLAEGKAELAKQIFDSLESEAIKDDKKKAALATARAKLPG